MILKPQKFSSISKGHRYGKSCIFSGLFNEGSGGMIADSSGRGHNGVTQNGLWVPGKFGPALDFGGGDPELVTNGIFSAWTTDDPDGWAVAGESGTDPEVSEVGTGEGHGGIGTGMCNIYTSDGTYVQISQAVNLVVGRKYTFSMTIDTVILGSIQVTGLPGGVRAYSTTGVKSFDFIATTTVVSLAIKRTGICDITVDDVSIKAVLDYIAIPNTNVLDIGAVSTSCWINIDTGWSSSGYIFAKMEDYDIGGEMSYALYLDSDRKLVFVISDDGDSPTTVRTSISALAKSTWYYVVVTYDGAGSYRIYVNGVRVADDGAGSATGPIYAGIGRLTLAARYDSSESRYKTFFTGLIDNMMIWRRALSAGDIMSLYRNSFQMYDQDETELV